MGWEWITVPSFGGGLNFATHPTQLDPSEWTECDGWIALDGIAETARPYVERLAANWHPDVPFSHDFNGIHQEPFSFLGPVLTFCPNGAAGGQMRLVRFNASTGATTEFAWDGVGTAPVSHKDDRTQVAFCNGYLVVAGGAKATGNYSLLRWNNAATYNAINPTNPLKLGMIAAFGGRLVGAQTAHTQAGIRTLRWSDANSTTVWDPAISNSADEVLMEDSISGVTALAPTANNVVLVYTREATYALSPTGAIPAFTLQRIADVGCHDTINSTSGPIPLNHSQATVTPYGVFTRGPDDFFLNQQSSGRKIWRWFQKRSDYTTQAQPPIWHPRMTQLAVPIYQQNEGASWILWFDPRTGAWSRQTCPTSAVSLRHAVIRDGQDQDDGTYQGRHWLLVTTTGQMLVQNFESGAAHAGGVVATKDFTVGAPPVTFEVDRIKVEWEDMGEGPSTLTVSAAMRHDWGDVTSGDGLDTAATFTVLGTLSGTVSELPVRLRGKYLRWKFTQTTGPARIRGFSFRVQPAADRRVT